MTTSESTRECVGFAELISSIANEKQDLCIEIRDRQGMPIGHLAPVTKSSTSDGQLVEKLTEWRNRSMKNFFTQYTATCERTQQWLESTVLTDPTRLLFVIHSKAGSAGAIGFKILPDRSVELGNLVRGERCGHYQLTYYAELALIDWIFQALPVDVIFGISKADNLMCSTLQRSLGFRRAQRIPLLKTEHGGELHFRFGEPGAKSPDGLYAQKFELDRAEFFRRKSHWPWSSA